MAPGRSFVPLNKLFEAIEHHHLYFNSQQVSFLCSQIIILENEEFLKTKTRRPTDVSQGSIDLNKFIVDFCEKYDIVLDLEDIVPKPKTLWPNFYGRKYFSTLKLNYGGYGTVLVEGTKAYAAGYTFEGKSYQFKKIVPGIYLSEYGFHKQMEKMFNDMLPEKVVIYLDTVYVFGDTEDELYSNARQVIKRISEKCKMPVDNAECTLFQKSIELLGYKVSNNKLSIPPSVLEDIKKIERPVVLLHLFDFMSTARFYKEMIKGFARLAAPLTELLDAPQPVLHKVKWQQKHQISFEVVQKKLLMEPTLAICDERAEKVLYVTSSKIAIEGDLYQINLKTKEKEAIGYFSNLVEADMENWETFDLEMFTIAESCQFFQPYLKKSFDVYTMNPPQMYKNRFKNPTARLKKLRSKIGSFSFKVRQAVTAGVDKTDFYEFIKKT